MYVVNVPEPCGAIMDLGLRSRNFGEGGMVGEEQPYKGQEGRDEEPECVRLRSRVLGEGTDSSDRGRSRPVPMAEVAMA